MKELTLLNRAKAILSSQKGESLMESIASILIFNILMLAVATMIKTSLRITEHSTASASSRQEQANDFIIEDYDSTLVPSDTRLVLQDTSGLGIGVKIDVKFYDDGTFQAFTPATSGVTPP